MTDSQPTEPAPEIFTAPTEPAPEPVAPMPESPAAPTEPTPEAERTVPLARLQGVQRELTNAQKATTTVAAERDAARAEIATLSAQLAEANRAHAAALIAQIKATDAEAVHELITGDTPEAVQASHQLAKTAYASARSAYARSLPTSAPAPSQLSRPMATQPDTRSAVQLIADGLSALKPNIN